MLERRWARLMALGLAFALSPGSSDARTWRVEANGTGDYTIIRAAILAASPGDSILVGAGRYTFSAPFSPQPGSWVERTYVGVDKDNLTIRGTDRDAVIIGPTTPNFTTYGPKGFVTHVSVTRLTVANLTLENVHDGFYLIGNATIADCNVRGCDLGVFGVDGVTLRVERCHFLDCRDAVIAFDGHDLEVVDSTFLGHSEGVSYVRCRRGNVRRCTFTDGLGGTKHEESDGVVEQCTFVDNASYGIGAIASGGVLALANSIHGGETSIKVVNSASVTGSANLLLGATFASVYLLAYSSAVLSSNDILPAPGVDAVRLGSYASPGASIDLRNNYWGVDTAVDIAARICDSHDDPTIHATVLFEPFAVRSVFTEPVSIGALTATVVEPASFAPPRPNPFNPSTELVFSLPAPGPVELAIYNLRGELVSRLRSGAYPAGNYRVRWEGLDDRGTPVASGTYLARLNTPTSTFSRRLLLLK